MRFFDQDFTCNIKDSLLNSEYESVTDIRNRMNAELNKPVMELINSNVSRKQLRQDLNTTDTTG